MAFPDDWRHLPESARCALLADRVRKIIRRLRRAKREPDPWEATHLVEAIGGLRLHDYDATWEALDLVDLRGKQRRTATPMVAPLDTDDLAEWNLDRFASLIARIQCPVANEVAMELQSSGSVEFGPDGFYMAATDGKRKIVFILSEPLAIKVLHFDMHGAELLERTVRDRLPAIWEASRHAYALAPKDTNGQSLRIDLAEEDFQAD